MRWQPWGWLACAPLWLGCSAAVASGITHTPHDAVQVQTRLQLDSTRARSNGPVLGAALVLGHAEGRPIHAHNARARIGYGVQSDHTRWSAQLVYELGAGEPSARDYDGTGVLFGAYADVAFRLTGPGQRPTNHYYLASGALDVFVAAHGGVWSAPAGDQQRELIEWGLLMGLRVGLTSDVLVSTEDR